jgi:hypothetical protein
MLSSFRMLAIKLQNSFAQTFSDQITEPRHGSINLLIFSAQSLRSLRLGGFAFADISSRGDAENAEITQRKPNSTGPVKSV